MEFVPRPGSKLDEKMQRIIQDNQLTIPIIWIKGELYLVGSERINCQCQGENLTVRTGGGYE